ncbi:LamG-like jellyroll fold domain-containing protein [Streptomyces sp. NPDC056835]|uniref:LamG domain-containing protein n=1 Tax=Streptomyces sp. NPDC056835 TaxID=3345956 RepID=UPI0036AB75BD
MRKRRRLLTAGSLVVAAVLAAQGTAVAAENLPPERPAAADLLSGGKPCVSGEDRPFVRSLPALTTVLYDQPADGQSFPDRVSAEFEMWWQDSTGTEQRKTLTTTAKSSGSPFGWQLSSASDLPADTVVSWRVRAHDDRGATSAWSDEGGATACEFVYDRTVPGKPSVTSPDYPDDTVASGGVGVYASFILDAPDDDVVAYRYDFLGGPSLTAEPAEPGGSVTLRYLPQRSGTLTLSAGAMDRAGNVSASTTFYFRVRSGGSPAAHWKLSDAAGSGSAAAEAGPAAPAGTGVTFGAPAPAGTTLTSAATLDGTEEGFLTPGASLIDTEKTFAVGGWVRPERLDRDATAISQDAGTEPGFGLGARTGDGEPVWSFASGGARVSGGAPEVGEWAHVLGQYDAETGMTRLYVNGREVGTARRATAAPSVGDLQLGRARDGAGYRDHWQGALGDVRVYERVVVAAEVAELAKRTPAPRGHWSLENARDGVSPELYDGAPLKLGAGATIHRGPGDCLPELDPDCPQVEYALVGDGDLWLDGATGFAATDEPVVDTDDSFTLGVVVRLADAEPERPMTVLSQGGANGDAFKVRYDPATYSWQLVVAHADEPGAAETVVGQSVWPDEPQRLAVVYDDATDRITLYVNGEAGADASASFRHSWKSTGGLQVGRGRTADGWGEYLRGSVDEVHAFSGALGQVAVQQLGQGSEPCLPC